MTMYSVYIIQCRNGAYYVGYTNDLDRRLKMHREGRGSKYVRAFKFSRIVFQEKFRSKSRAMRREAEIKGWSRSKKMALVSCTK